MSFVDLATTINVKSNVICDPWCIFLSVKAKEEVPVNSVQDDPSGLDNAQITLDIEHSIGTSIKLACEIC